MLSKPAPDELRRVAFTARIAPSNISVWRASRREGEKFTGHQLAALERRGLDPDTVEVLEVRSAAGAREWYWPSWERAPVFVFECPVLERRGNRVLVISPRGSAEPVYADGSIVHRSSKRV